MNKIKIIFVIFWLILLFINIGCGDNVIGYDNKFETKYRIYYTTSASHDYTIYTDSEVITCSFNGTNYLVEKGNTEELVSTTAPIRILKQYKFDENGNKSEYTGTY